MNEKIKPPYMCRSCESDDGFELRRRVLGNQSVQIVFQCLTCGRSGANPIARASVRNPDQLPAWDDGLAEQYDNRKQQVRAEDKAEWFREHDEYLNSDKWRQKRQKVIQRCRGVCEGCMDAPVQHVHHITYEHWKDELLFELLGLCEPCHERAHGRSLGAQAEQF